MSRPAPRRSRIRRLAARSLGLVPVLLPLLALAGCRGEPANEGVEVRHAFAPTPPIVGPVRLVLEVRGPDGAPLEGAEVVVEGTMTHAGMTPVREPAEEEGGGRYVVPELEFSMGGDWIVITHVELPAGGEARHEHEVRVVGGPPPGGDGR